MRFLFWPGVIGVALLEIGLVYFIMPLPGSQRMRGIELAYALYTWRCIAWATFALMIAPRAAGGVRPTGRRSSGRASA